MVKVCFEYDEGVREWEVVIEGVVSSTEAIQAFNAVVITIRDAPVHMCQAVPVDDLKYRLDFFVRNDNLKTTT